ncbi:MULTISPECIES: carboxypeptidase-like regulatory domain-containing protein [Acidobacteriaceae]|uniref:carboxypeptidase-like regulatory domain-containing protein n=1 Tax=Acidobacteriaceae TaxID=204434 RepID=UPI00131AC8B0|nr:MULTISPECIES: carboxypeptidase-like regulatory domain-containing protein [Acidobacteriaceae]MDW5265497.1 carboxypeptidase-like regulatory domain-containing protein [Edaphobacter sp.]
MKNPLLTVRRALRIVATAALLSSTLTVAQMNLAILSGTTIDQDGALIQDAQVTARNTLTEVERRVETGKRGTFRLLDLSPGTYDIRAKHPGFEQVEVSNVALHIGDERKQLLKITFGRNYESASEEYVKPNNPHLLHIVDRDSLRS